MRQALVLWLLLWCSGGGVGASTGYSAQEPKASRGSITGRITIGGKPAPGVRVSASSPSTLPLYTAVITSGKNATTDTDGRYSISDLAAGTYYVTVTAPALVPDAAQGRNNSRQVTLGDNETVEGIDFSLIKGGVITGRVMDSQGRPVIAEQIIIRAPPNADPAQTLSLSEIGPRTYHTDDRGVYRVYGLAPGQYIIGAGSTQPGIELLFGRRKKFQTTYYPGVSDPSRARPIEVGAGTEANGIDIQMAPASIGFSLRGRVIDGETRAPVTKGFVMLSGIRVDASVKSLEPDDPSLRGGIATIGSTGEFKFESLKPGKYRLEAAQLGVLTGETGFFSDRQEIVISGSDVENVEVTVHRGATISGVVIVSNSVSPDVVSQLSSLILSTSSKDQGVPESVARISADGTFKLGGLKPGEIELEVETGFGNAAFSIDHVERDGINLGETIEIQEDQQITGVKVFVTYGACIVQGHVAIEGGERPRRSRLRVSAHLLAGSSKPATSNVGQAGDFSISNLVPGDYQITAKLEWFNDETTRPEAITASQVVTVSEGSPAEVKLVLNVKSKRNQ